jgi:amino acid adenylation domain-containing protein
LKIAAARRRREMGFWTERVPASMHKARFPQDQAPRGEPRRGRYQHEFDALIAERLWSAASRQVPALRVLLAAQVAALAARYTGLTRIPLGMPASFTEAQEAPLATWLPIYPHVEPSTSLRTLLGAVHQEYAAAVAHQDCPMALLIDAVGLPVEEHVHPFFDIAVDASDGEVSGPHHDHGIDGVPLLISLCRDGDRWQWDVDFDARMYQNGTVARLVGHLASQIASSLSAPDAAMGAISLDTDADAQIIGRSNATQAAYRSTTRLDQILSEQAQRTPDAVAVVCGAERLTYRAFEARVNQLAHTLQDAGVQPDQLVAVIAHRGVDMLVAIHAVIKAGGAYLPIDPGYPRSRIEYVLEDSAASVVLAHPELVPEIKAERKIIDLRDPRSYDSRTCAPRPAGDAHSVAYAIYTSGSTGMPKGVLVEHHSAINRIAWMQKAYPLRAGDVILQKTPISFDVSVWELFWWSFVGATVSLLPPGGEKDPEQIIETIERDQVTTLHFVPSMLHAFLEYAQATRATKRLHSVKQVFASGEALGVHHVRLFYALLGNNAKLINLYGPTEATVDVSHHLCVLDERAVTVPIGKPIDNIRLYVVDRQLRKQPLGVPGELVIAGVGLARGYHRRPELTADRFVDNPFDGEARIYRTGDLARWNEKGEIEYLGRIDNQVKIRGYRIELGEIEARLRQHPSVSDAFVMAHALGGREAELCAYVTGTSVAPEELLRFVGETLPEYMVPSSLTHLDAFPLSPNGKLDRKALPLPQRDQQAYVAPRTPVESTLAQIWSEVLGAAKVGIHDNFFSLGGNSIHFVAVLAKARHHGLQFTFQQLFSHPTIAALSQVLAHVDSSAQDAAQQPFALLQDADRARIPASAEDAYPLSLLQTGLIFENELTFGTSQYHDILSYTIETHFDRPAFEKAVRAVVARNPIMRTSYHLTGYEVPLQIVHKDMPLPLEVFDVRGLDPAGQDTAFEAWTAAERNRRFAWEEPGLVRFYVHVLSDNLFRYTLTQHNSALDGWSITLVHTQLFEAYHAAREGREAAAPKVGNFFRDFIALEQDALRSEDDRLFWRNAIEGTALTQLPRCAPPQADTDTKAVPKVIFHDVDIPRTLSNRIVALSDRLGVPVKTVLMAAHLKVLSVLGNTDFVSTGYEQSGRPEHIDATEALGLFLNTVPFGIEVGLGSWEDLIRRVFDAESALLPHRRYPMAQMKHDLGIRDHLFETAFNYTHFYRLKELKKLPEFSLLDVRANSETEFIVRAEFSRHFFTDDVRLSLHYHDQVFAPQQMVSMGSLYRRAFELMTENVAALHAPQTLVAASELARTAQAAQDACAKQPPDGAARAVREVLRNARSVEILDRHGVPVPMGVYGELVLTRENGVPTKTDWIARWMPDWSLDLAGPAHEVQQRTRVTIFGDRRMKVPARVSRGTVTTLTPAEQRIAAVWAQLLKRPAAEIDADDNFFSIGGNSLMAIRVVLMLDGDIKLADLMTRPTLRELAQVLDRGTGSSASLLVRYAGHDTPLASVVCLPYAGGSSASFQSLAQSVVGLGAALSVYGVDLPGHELVGQQGALLDVEAMAAQIAMEIRATVGTPVVLWGHCVGAAMALAVESELQKAGHEVVRVFIGGKLLPSMQDAEAGIAAMDRMSNADVLSWMVKETGHTELAELAAQHADRLVTLFRHDARTANRYLGGLAAGRPQRLPSLTVVFADDDPLTKGYETGYSRWQAVCDELRMTRLPDGGHYFCRTRANEVARIIVNELEKSNHTMPGGMSKE